MLRSLPAQEQTANERHSADHEGLTDLLVNPPGLPESLDRPALQKQGGGAGGAFEWNIPSVGVWEGTWTAPVVDLMTYESELSMVGHGVGGVCLLKTPYWLKMLSLRLGAVNVTDHV